MRSKNLELIDLFNKLSIEESNPFKSKVFYNFSELIKNNDPEDIESLRSYKGVGNSCIAIAKEFISTGKCDRLNASKDPRIFIHKIPGIGLSRAKVLINSGYRDPDDLIKLNLKFGDIIPNTNLKVTKMIELGLKYMTHAKTSTKMTKDEYEKISLPLLSNLKLKLNNNDIYLVGSYRRNSDLIGDIDVIIFYSEDYDRDLYIRTIIDQLDDVESLGNKKISGIINGKHIDIKIVDKCYYGPMMLHFTGPVSYNVKLRSHALKNNMKLSEYGLFNEYGLRIDDNSEESILEKLDLEYIEPSKRI